jgi:sulfatase maturation enzyme AslB (radical SAM superfamily)
MKSTTIFPIKQDPACLLKWGFSTVFLNTGQSSSCHRCVPSDIPLDDFNSFHNLPDKVQARKTMLEGQWPSAGCQYCQKTEEADGVSDRLLQLGKLQDPNLVAPELWQDATATEVTPTMLEIYFKNTCNMKCMYCRPDQSSQWEQELRKFGPMKTRSFKVAPVTSKSDYEKRKKDLWQWLEKNYQTLRRFHVLGGEPLLMEETEECLDFWMTHPNPDLVFSMFTNGNVDIDRFEKLLQKMQHLVENNQVWKFQITVSIDCWGAPAEYVRFGLDWNLFKRNFERLVEIPWLDLSVNSAVTALTIKYMPDLIRYLNLNDQKRMSIGSREIDRSFNLA